MRFERIMVEVTGLEPAASCSQSRRATTCATPRYFYINFCLVSLFSSLLCPPSCGSRNLFGSIMSLDIPTAVPKNARFFCHRQRSRFLPKAGAPPPALHLDADIIWIQLKYYSIINSSCQLLSISFYDRRLSVCQWCVTKNQKTSPLSSKLYQQKREFSNQEGE